MLGFGTLPSGVTASGTTTATVALADNDGSPWILTASPVVAPENATTVVELEAGDADTAAAELSWSIAGGADASAFVVTAAGTLSFRAAKDFETPDDADGDGTYEVTVRVSDGEKVDTANLQVSLSNVNEAPVADAGADQSGMSEGAVVTLDASGSSDPDAGDTLSYLWTQTDGGGRAVALSDPTAPRPSFTAPSNLTADAVLEFTLRVTDAAGLYAQDTVAVTVAALPVVSVRPASDFEGEGSDAVFTLTLGVNAVDALSVGIVVEESGAMLGTPVPASVEFAAGARVAELRVPTADDGTNEPDSTVTVQVVAGSGYRLTEGAVSASVTMLDNDAAPPVPAIDTLWSADMRVREYTSVSIGAATADLFSNQGGSAELRGDAALVLPAWAHAAPRIHEQHSEDGGAHASRGRCGHPLPGMGRGREQLHLRRCRCRLEGR